MLIPDFTQIVNRARMGDTASQTAVIENVYQELKSLARRQVGNEVVDVQATMLVNETYLKLFGGKSQAWENRRHFFGAAAQAMRQLLIDMARARNTQRRGGLRLQFSLSESMSVGNQAVSVDELLDLDRALRKLESEDEQLGRLVALRFFAGQTVENVADIMNLSVSSIERKWRLARAFLIAELSEGNSQEN